MSLFSLLKTRRQSAEVVALLCADSGSVTVGLAVLVPQVLPEIVWTSREPFFAGHDVKPERLEAVMIEVAGRGIKRLYTEGLDHLKFTRFGHGRISKAAVFLGSPWSSSEVKFVNLKKDEPFPITRELLARIREDEIKKFLSSDDRAMYSQGSGGALELIEELVIDVSLNGYSTARPERKRTRTIDMTLALGATSERIKQRIEETFRRELRVPKVSFHTSVTTAFLSIRDMFPERHDFLVVSIGSELSEISIILNNILHETVSFPIGVNHLFRSIARKLDLSPAMARTEALLSLAKGDTKTKDQSGQGRGRDYGESSKDRVSVANAGSVSKEIELFRDKWTKDFYGVIEILSKDHILPRDIFVLIEEDLQSLISPCVGDARFSQFGLGNELCVSHFLNVEALTTFCRLNRAVAHDTALICQTVFMNHVHRP
jgi:hypothetical protein